MIILDINSSMRKVITAPVVPISLKNSNLIRWPIEWLILSLTFREEKEEW